MDDELNNEQGTQVNLPPVIEPNPRFKILPEKISLNAIVLKTKGKLIPESLVKEQSKEKQAVAVPRYELTITWSPNALYFDIEDEIIVRKIWLWNSCPRIIYLKCCGFWDETARLGASWCCRPHTRFHIAPGLKAELTIKVTPKTFTPVPMAYCCIQIAAAHKRDNVSGYFYIPMHVTFHKYKEPCQGEE